MATMAPTSPPGPPTSVSARYANAPQRKASWCTPLVWRTPASHRGVGTRPTSAKATAGKRLNSWTLDKRYNAAQVAAAAGFKFQVAAAECQAVHDFPAF